MHAEYLDFLNTQKQFTARVREPSRYPVPEGVDEERMQVYQTLLFNNIESILSNAFPVIHRIYNDDGWLKLVRDFFASHKSTRPIFHQIPEEFLHYLSDTRDSQDDPAWLFELAHYEWLELALDLSQLTLDDAKCCSKGQLLNGIPCMSPLAWPQYYQYPVHMIGPKHIPKSPKETFLIVYRNRDEKVKFMQINAFTLQLVNLISNNEQRHTGREILEHMAVSSNHPNPDVLVQGGAVVLAKLLDNDIILGTCV
jgi:hypothetical protein